MTRGDLIAFLRTYKVCVQASVHPDGRPQAAVVGHAVSDDLELVFDTVTTSRKFAYPDGRDRLRDWPNLTYLRVRPTWARHSDYTTGTIVELTAEQLR